MNQLIARYFNMCSAFSSSGEDGQTIACSSLVSRGLVTRRTRSRALRTRLLPTILFLSLSGPPALRGREMRSWCWCPPASQSRSLVTTESPRPAPWPRPASWNETATPGSRRTTGGRRGGRQSLGRDLREVAGDSSFDI